VKQSEYTHLTMQNCFVCRKRLDPDNRHEGGHVKLDDGARILVAYHPDCPKPHQSTTRRGCYGRWQKWMGLIVGVRR
jgi:hypothetical protein